VSTAFAAGEVRHEKEVAMTTRTATAAYSPPVWTSGDWNAFFGFGTNILVNMLVLTGLLRFVVKMPDSIVFGRILPALGLMLCLSTMYYAFLAYRLAQNTGRNDVCALPSGVSVPHMFIVTFVIMLPIALKTNDPIIAGSRRAPHSSARSPACRSLSSPCVRRWKCT
jgi:adenine/guanine/hypoxanthine permease